MNIMIIGAGSLGLLFAAKLSAFCEHMTVITRTRDQAAELSKQGILLAGTADRFLTTGNGVIEFGHFLGGEKLASTSLKHVDYIFLMVKQPAITQELVDYLKTQIHTKTYLVSFQNGIGHEEMLREKLGWDRLLLAVTTEGARREGLTAVAHTGHGVTYMGTGEDTDIDFENSPHIMLVRLLEQAGFHTRMSKNMNVRIWVKLTINAVINPLTAILRVKNGELLDSPWARSLMQALFQEVCILAEAKGVGLPDDLWETLLNVCKATSENHSSMLQDIEQSRSTEIDRINGSLLQMAKKLELELPAHQIVYQLVKALE